ncbi:MAG: hypothetical protein UU87_C0008G0005 [Parcubacteria group bacterium GW2011_GWA2_42_11]|nr:MAG: hypothetical protein UU87_C0008G0005 [Parcubacteria group bacterium GW2011_GWA2_42_11]
MKAILDSIQPVIKNSKFVRIDEDAILKFSKQVEAKDMEDSEFGWETTLPKDVPEEKQIALPFVYNTVNFCYWGEPKWTIEINGKFHDGSAGMLRAVKNAIDNGFNLLDPEYLANISEEDLATILRGNVEIPLFQERLRLLRELGKNLLEKYSGSFTAVVKKAEGNATKMVELLVKDFPEVFNDTAVYHSGKVKFYKRVQLIPAHLFDLAKFGLVSIPLTGFNELTAFADYKVPQLLRKFGMLVYANGLAEKIDNKIEISSGGEEEIEIRANTIWAIEIATKILKEKFPQANAAKVDGIFWFKGQDKSPNDKPYHRTRTIWY